MKNHALKNAIEHWGYIAPLVVYPKNERDFETLVSRLDELLEMVGDNEKHPLVGLVDIMSHIMSL